MQNNRWIEGVHSFQIFDAPSVVGDYGQRMKAAARAVRGCRHAGVVAVEVIKDRREVFSRLQEVQGRGGEGIMLRHPGVTTYETGRTKNLLKSKAHTRRFFYWNLPNPAPVKRRASVSNN